MTLPRAAGAAAVEPARTWRCRDRVLAIVDRPLVMGVVNVTPDSFSDGGHFLEPAAAVEHAFRLAAEGADIVDLGAESTRPGAEPVPAAAQLRRLVPVLEPLARAGGVCVSVDTASAEVARAALDLGAHVVNDVTALGDPAMPAVVAAAGAGVVLMHMQGEPRSMQRAPRYADVAREVAEFLGARLAAARAAGIAADCVALDPGIGFGKTLEHNLQLIARLGELAALGRPVVLGASRKRFLGTLTGDAPADQRLEAGLAAAAIAVWNGAGVVRTHDVAATARAVRVVAAIARARRDAAHD